MAEFPALPLWTDAYMADTMHLDCVESGAYLHLLMAAWRTPDCRLPNDNKRLARFAKCTTRQWSKVRDVVLSFWKLEEHEGEQKWSQKRLLAERKWVLQKSDQGKRAANARWLKNKETDNADALTEHMPEGCESDTPIPTPIPTPNELINTLDVNCKGGGSDPRKILLSGEDIEAAKKHAGGYDIYDLESRWKEWAKDKNIKNPPANFIAFVKRNKEQNPNPYHYE